MTKLAPEWVRTNDPLIRSPARYRWTAAPAGIVNGQGLSIIDVDVKSRGPIYTFHVSGVGTSYN